MEARRKSPLHNFSRSSSSAKLSTRTTTPHNKRMNVFERLYKESGLSRVKGLVLPEYKTEDPSFTQIKSSGDAPSTEHRSGKAGVRPVFIKKQRRTFSNDSQIESFINDPRLRVPLLQPSVVFAEPVSKKAPNKVSATIRGVDYLSSEPHISRLRDRLKKSKETASPTAQRSLLSMDLLNRSTCWLAKRDSDIKAKQEEVEKKKLEEERYFKPVLVRPKSCVKLRQKEHSAEKRPRSKRTLSNSYLEMHQLKQKASLSFLFGDDTISPNSATKISYSKPQSVDVSFQDTPSNSRAADKRVFKSSTENQRKGYMPLSPTKQNYCISTNIGPNRPVLRSKSPLKDSLTLDLSFCKYR
mmetsp:Transcript_13270/g.24885  ORF Transcript_13270/g.24885 Transcript_13270/m.24885 type:complete len:355 (+) Transcript_13270:36-1100(+)